LISQRFLDSKVSIISGQLLIQKSDATASEEHSLVFEAAWNEGGAVCVHHSRIPENVDLQKLIATCPEKFSAVNTGASCTKENYPNALIYNESKQTGSSL
jgi:hypothetical protein